MTPLVAGVGHPPYATGACDVARSPARRVARIRGRRDPGRTGRASWPSRSGCPSRRSGTGAGSTSAIAASTTHRPCSHRVGDSGLTRGLAGGRDRQLSAEALLLRANGAVLGVTRRRLLGRTPGVSQHGFRGRVAAARVAQAAAGLTGGVAQKRSASSPTSAKPPCRCPRIRGGEGGFNLGAQIAAPSRSVAPCVAPMWRIPAPPRFHRLTFQRTVAAAPQKTAPSRALRKPGRLVLLTPLARRVPMRRKRSVACVGSGPPPVESRTQWRSLAQ